MRSTVVARPSAPAVEPVGADQAMPQERTPQEHRTALDEAITYFRARDPEGWDELALCPLQHGVETILEKLKAVR